jgi:hypothetical protein
MEDMGNIDTSAMDPDLHLYMRGQGEDDSQWIREDLSCNLTRLKG